MQRYLLDMKSPEGMARNLQRYTSAQPSRRMIVAKLGIWTRAEYL